MWRSRYRRHEDWGSGKQGGLGTWKDRGSWQAGGHEAHGGIVGTQVNVRVERGGWD